MSVITYKDIKGNEDYSKRQAVILFDRYELTREGVVTDLQKNVCSQKHNRKLKNK